MRLTELKVNQPLKQAGNQFAHEMETALAGDFDHVAALPVQF